MKTRKKAQISQLKKQQKTTINNIHVKNTRQ